jgi:hypothetical protein
MDTFSLDPRAWRVLFLFSRSPLVRRSDRLEVLVIALALAISLLALPFIATIATDVYQAHRGIYVDQATTRHRASIPTPASTNVAPASAYLFRVGSRWGGTRPGKAAPLNCGSTTQAIGWLRPLRRRRRRTTLSRWRR